MCRMWSDDSESDIPSLNSAVHVGTAHDLSGLSGVRRRIPRGQSSPSLHDLESHMLHTCRRCVGNRCIDRLNNVQ